VVISNPETGSCCSLKNQANHNRDRLAPAVIFLPQAQLKVALLLPRMPSDSRKKFTLAALTTALLWWLSMTQWGLFAFGWIAFVPLLFVLSDIENPRTRFLYGWGAGLLCYALHNWWLLPTVTKAGGVIGVSPVIGALLGALSVGLIATVHGLGLAFLAWLWNPRTPLFRNIPLLLPVCCALLWWAFEWLRSYGVLGHTWGAPAFSQWSNIALLQSAYFMGQFGLSALCIWFAACMALWVHPENTAKAPGMWRIPLLVFAMLHLWGVWRIERYDRMPHTPTPIALVATNVASLAKKREGGESHFSTAWRLSHETLSAQSAHPNRPQLVVWPETTLTLGAAPTAAQQREDIETLSQSLATPILAGAQVFENNGTMTNDAVLIESGQLTQRSGKMRVVPFGERAPFSESLLFLAMLAPRPPVTPATYAMPMQLRRSDGSRWRLGTVICFESAFPRPAKSLVEDGAEALFVLTNDEWFAGTSAPWEHAAMCALRAAQNQIPVVQVANGGYALMTDGVGRFISLEKSDVSKVVTGTIPIISKD